MEKTKSILQRVIKIMLIVLSLINIIQVILLFKWHLEFYPAIIQFYPHDITLPISITILFIMTKKFKMKYLVRIALIGIVLAYINLVGFNIFINLAYKITSQFPCHFVPI